MVYQPFAQLAVQQQPVGVLHQQLLGGHGPQQCNEIAFRHAPERAGLAQPLISHCRCDARAPAGSALVAPAWSSPTRPSWGARTTWPKRAESATACTRSGCKLSAQSMPGPCALATQYCHSTAASPSRRPAAYALTQAGHRLWWTNFSTPLMAPMSMPISSVVVQMALTGRWPCFNFDSVSSARFWLNARGAEKR